MDFNEDWRKGLNLEQCAEILTTHLKQKIAENDNLTAENYELVDKIDDLHRLEEDILAARDDFEARLEYSEQKNEDLKKAALEIYDWMMEFTETYELEMMCPIKPMEVICPDGWKERVIEVDPKGPIPLIPVKMRPALKQEYAKDNEVCVVCGKRTLVLDSFQEPSNSSVKTQFQTRTRCTSCNSCWYSYDPEILVGTEHIWVTRENLTRVGERTQNDSS